MASPARKRRLSPEQRRALELPAGSSRGITEEMLIYGHGFRRPMLAGLVRAGLARVPRRVIMAGGMPVEVGKIVITAQGWRAIEK